MNELNTEYKITEEQKIQFRKDGVIKLKNILSLETIAEYEKIISATLNEHNNNTLPMEERNIYDKAFIQVGQLWEKNQKIKEFSFSQRLAGIARDLMGTSNVRIYHDQALYKEAKGGVTPWHYDQYYWPFDTMKSCTIWMPLVPVDFKMGPLCFAKGSQFYEGGRDLAISANSENYLAEKMQEEKFEIFQETFELGEATFHYGWTAHFAPANQTNKIRKVMTIIYMDSEMKLIEPVTTGQEDDRENFFPSLKVGDFLETKATPVLLP